MKLSELAKKIEAELRLSGEDIDIKGISGIETAQEGEITFISNPKYLKKVEETHASAVIVGEGVCIQKEISLLVAKNPYLAFAKALEILKAKKPEYKKGIDKNAVVLSPVPESVSIGAFCYIDKNVKIGENVVLMPCVYVGEGAEIGEGTFIYPNVSIREGVKIGKNCIIHCGTVIGSDGYGYVTIDGRHTKIPQTGTVEIHDNVEIGANVTIDRATIEATVIGEGTKIDNLVQIAHNVKIGKHCLIVAQVGIAGSTKIGDFVTVAGQAGIAGHLNIGNRVVIGAQAGVIGNVPDGEVVSGFPARKHSLMMKVYAAMLELPEIIKKLKIKNEKWRKG